MMPLMGTPTEGARRGGGCGAASALRRRSVNQRLADTLKCQRGAAATRLGSRGRRRPSVADWVRSRFDQEEETSSGPVVDGGPVVPLHQT